MNRNPILIYARYFHQSCVKKMKGVQNIYHHSYTFSFFLVLILFHPTLSIVVNMMSSTESLTISSNRTLVSSGGVFELGFFKPSALSRWYLWNGSEFSGIPEVQGLSYMVYDYTENSEEVAYTFLMANQSIYSRLKISELGYLYRFTWIPPSWGWNIFWTLPTDDCDIYESYGPYAYCLLRPKHVT